MLAIAISSLALLAVQGEPLAEEQSLPETMPAPEQRPSEPRADAKPTTAKANEMPVAEKACRSRLRALGVTFTEFDPQDLVQGCAVQWPISVSDLPGGVELKPEATLTCAMAEATARFVKEKAKPIAQSVIKSELTGIQQVSSYVCRARTDGKKLSEHARANALDWGSLEFANGTTMAVRAYSEPDKDERALIDKLMRAACGPFKTVLGPGSDADHADHFHFDLAERRNGGTWCK